jgi:hypothetical protein
MDAWVERELAGVVLPHHRLTTRLGRLLADFADRIGGTVPMACQDWAATKPAYRFLDNPRVTDRAILGGHFAATAGRFAAAAGTVLVLHDTTEFSFTRNTPDGVGYLSYVKGRHATHTACGVLLHSSLAVTTDGLPLGLAAAKFWSRRVFKGTNAAKRTVSRNPMNPHGCAASARRPSWRCPGLAPRRRRSYRPTDCPRGRWCVAGTATRRCGPSCGGGHGGCRG